MPQKRPVPLTQKAWIRGSAYLNEFQPSSLGLRLKGYTSVTIDNIPMRLTCRGFPSNRGAGIMAFRRHVALLAMGKWEPEVSTFLGRMLTKGDVFIDVGAWLGVHTLFASTLVGENGRVFSFEPDPVAHKMLRRNITLNHARNVELHTEALSDTIGTSNLVPITAFGMSYSGVLEQTSSVGIPIQTTTLDQFVSNACVIPKIVKVDVEGFEDKVIAGGKGTVSNPNTCIVIEFHSKQLVERGQDPQAVFRSLFGFGKEVVAIASRGKLHEEDLIPGETGCCWNDGHIALVPSAQSAGWI